MYAMERVSDHKMSLIPDHCAELYLNSPDFEFLEDDLDTDGVFFYDANRQLWGLTPMGIGSLDQNSRPFNQDDEDGNSVPVAA